MALRLRGNDLHLMHAVLPELYANRSLEERPRAVLALMERLVPAELSVYYEIDPVGPRLFAVTYPNADSAEAITAIPNWARWADQHPLLRHFRALPDDPPRRLTDLIPQREFVRSDLFRRVFAAFDVRYQVITTLPSNGPRFVGIAQHRARRNFTNREISILNHLRPHLRHAHDHACAVLELHHQVHRREHALGRLQYGVMLIDTAMRVKLATPLAQRFLAEYLQQAVGLERLLPPALRPWVGQQMAELLQPAKNQKASRPLFIDTATGRLVLRLIADPSPDTFAIVLQHAAPPGSAEALQGLGLTSREAQVLLGCVLGKSSADIGRALTISERTVQKHLEHIYQKLEVANRVAAVTTALEWLRL